MHKKNPWLIPCQWRNAPSFAELFTLQTIPKDLDVSSVEMITIFFVNSGNDHNFFSSGGIGHT